MGQSHSKTEQVVETLREILAEGGPAPERHPNQYLADMGFRTVCVVSTLDTRETLATFDILDLDKAEEEMDRYAATGKYTDRFGVALALEARK